MGGGGGCMVHKMNALAHQCGENTARVRMGCGGERKGVKYCNYHPIDFHWRDRENKCYSVNVRSTWWGGVRRERRESDFLFQSVHSFLFLQAVVPF